MSTHECSGSDIDLTRCVRFGADQVLISDHVSTLGAAGCAGDRGDGVLQRLALEGGSGLGFATNRSTSNDLHVGETRPRTRSE